MKLVSFMLYLGNLFPRCVVGRVIHLYVHHVCAILKTQTNVIIIMI